MPKLPPAIVDSLDAVPEAQREFYAPLGDGRFRLDAEGVEDVRGLKSAHEAQKVETREAKKLAQQYAGLGLSAEEIRALVDEKKARDEKRAKEEGNLEAWKAQVLEQKAAELGKKDERITKLTDSIERVLVDREAIAAIAELGGIPKLLLPHVRGALKVVEDEAAGEFTTVVVDKKGNTRYGSTGEPLTIKDYVAELKASDDFAGAFRGSGASGSGAAGSSAAAGAGAVRSKQDLKTDAAKAAFIGTHGLDAFKRLPAA